MGKAWEGNGMEGKVSGEGKWGREVGTGRDGK